MSKKNLFVLKFGGTPTSTPKGWRKILQIIQSYTGTLYIVLSAPGRRTDYDLKVTDLLIALCEARAKREDWEVWLGEVKERFQIFVTELDIKFDLDAEFVKIHSHIADGCSRDMILSRGEYLCAKLFAQFAGLNFADSYDYMTIIDGEPDLSRPVNLFGAENVGFVLPGFYGRGQAGEIVALSRGGSDASAAAYAKMLGASFDRWSDSPLRITDHRIVASANVVEYVTHQELSNIVTAVPSVMHPTAAAICHAYNIEAHVKDFYNPDGKFTRVMKSRNDNRDIVGVNLKHGYVDISLTQPGIGSKHGYIATFAGILSDLGLSVENPGGGNSSMSFAVHQSEFEKSSSSSLEEIVSIVEAYHKFKNPKVTTQDGISLVSIAGDMSGKLGYLHRASGALDRNKINIIGDESPRNEGLMNFYVAQQDGEKAVHALYREFV